MEKQAHKKQEALNIQDQTLAIRLLGEFSVSIHGQVVPDALWRLRKVKNLVKLLVLAPGHRLHRDQLIDALWPDATSKAGSNLFYQTLYAARRVLNKAGSACFLLENGFLSLAASVWVDVEQFEDAVVQAKDSQDPTVYRNALALYAGDLLPEDLYEEWAIQRREELRQEYFRLLQDLSRLEETHQNYPAGIDALLRLLASDPSNEEAHTGLMRLYAYSGMRQQALRQYQILREVLQVELAAEPSRGTVQLYEAILSGQFSPVESLISLPPTGGMPKHNLPAQLTSFIGRRKQINEISQLVLDHRLVTLTGSGGTGKTRLALKVAEGLLQDFPDGVFLAELAPLSDPELVPQVCTKSLNVPEQPGISLTDSLAQYLEKKHFLMILDNCEHVITSCMRLVDRLLKACPNLHILATSREILSIPGENAYRVPSLEVLDPHAFTSQAEMAQVESVQLFVDRAAQAAPGFVLTLPNAGLVAQIGQRLDGIPLAIELAAARSRMMTVEQIALRLDKAFHLLTGGSRAVLPRHQTLKAMIDWSYNLLTPKERLLFQRLSVFAGGWTLDATEEVCSDELDGQLCSEERLDSIEMMDLMTQLVDKSLVIAEAGESETRYRMLETIRQYARDRLLEAGCSGQVRDRHLAYFANLSGQAEPHLRGKGMIEWFNRLDHELDNLRVALEWSLTENVEAGLKMMADLMWFWWIRALFIEGFDWMRKLLAAESTGRGEGLLENGRALQRARCLRSISYLSKPISSLSRTEALALLEDSISILRRLGPLGRRELSISYIILLSLSTDINLPPEQIQEILETLHQDDMRFYLSEYLFTKQWLTFSSGDVENAEAYVKESLAICREIDDIDGIASRAQSYGLYAVLNGDYPKAEALFKEALEASQKTKNHQMEVIAWDGFVQLDLAQGRYEKAAQLNDVLLEQSRELNIGSKITDFLVQGADIAWARGDYQQIDRLCRELIEIYPQFTTDRAYAYFYQGRAALSEGNFSLAEALFKQSFSLLIDEDTTSTEMVIFFLGCATLFQKQSKVKQAAMLLGAVNTIFERTKFWLLPRERSEQAETLAATRAELGDELFTLAWQEGQAMTQQEANQYVLAELA